MTQGSLPPATAEGTLETSPLAQVMAHALERKLSGSIQLDTAAGTVATVVLHEGWPCKAKTIEPQYLGMVLHAQGLIDDTQLNASLARFATERRPHGQILLEMGVVPEDLQKGLRAQLTAKLEPLFGLPPATYFRFYERIDLLPNWGGPDLVRVDPLGVLWPAILRSPPWPSVRAVLGRMPPETPMRLNLRYDVARFRMSKNTAELVELMRMSPLTLDQMPSTQLVDENEAQLLVYAMLLTKQMVFLPPEAKRPSAVPAPPSAPVAATPPPEAPRIAPASVFPAGMQRPPGPPAKIGSVPPPARQSSLPARPSAPPPGVALTTELAAFRQRIIERVATINDEDYFEVLGIAREAPAQAAQAAYLALAKIWHPDRLAPQLFDVKDFSVKIFARMNDARHTLTSAELRGAYITQLRRGIRPDRVAHEETNVALEFQKAEFFMKKRDYAQAEAHCRRAREAEPANADYVALLVWIAVERDGPQIPPEHLHDHIEALTMAIKLNERCERAFFYRAQLWKRINRPEKAYQDYKAVVEINPKNIDAARETHLYKRRST